MRRGYHELTRTSDNEALLAGDNEVNVSGSDMDDDDRAEGVRHHLIGSHNITVDDEDVDSSSSDGDNSDDDTLPSDTTRFAELRVKQQQQPVVTNQSKSSLAYYLHCPNACTAMLPGMSQYEQLTDEEEDDGAIQRSVHCCNSIVILTQSNTIPASPKCNLLGP